MTILLLDSSNLYLSVGIKKDDKLVDKTHYQCFQRQSEMMIPEIKKLLEKNNISFFDLSGVMVSIGPGSYTGIRIGLTIAKILCYALKIPIYPISTLEINRIIGEPSIILFNARSNRSYIAAFSKEKRILDDQVMSNDLVKEFINSHKDYKIIGDLKYLDLNGLEVDILENMNILFDAVKPINDVNIVKPIYLKESYL